MLNKMASYARVRRSDRRGRSNSSPRGRICQTLECSKRPQNHRRKKLKSISQLAVQNLFVSINNFLTISEVRCRHFFYEILMSCHLDARKSWVRSEQVLRLLTKVFHSVYSLFPPRVVPLLFLMNFNYRQERSRR